MAGQKRPAKFIQIIAGTTGSLMDGEGETDHELYALDENGAVWWFSKGKQGQWGWALLCMDRL